MTYAFHKNIISIFVCVPNFFVKRPWYIEPSRRRRVGFTDRSTEARSITLCENLYSKQFNSIKKK